MVLKIGAPLFFYRLILPCVLWITAPSLSFANQCSSLLSFEEIRTEIGQLGYLKQRITKIMNKHEGKDPVKIIYRAHMRLFKMVMKNQISLEVYNDYAAGFNFLHYFINKGNRMTIQRFKNRDQNFSEVYQKAKRALIFISSI